MTLLCLDFKHNYIAQKIGHAAYDMAKLQHQFGQLCLTHRTISVKDRKCRVYKVSRRWAMESSDIDIGNLFSILAKCAVKTNRNVGLWQSFPWSRWKIKAVTSTVFEENTHTCVRVYSAAHHKQLRAYLLCAPPLYQALQMPLHLTCEIH